MEIEIPVDKQGPARYRSEDKETRVDRIGKLIKFSEFNSIFIQK
jgi:hypothetical protein